MIKTPVKFEPENGGLYDADGVKICTVIYQIGYSVEQCEQMEEIAAVLNNRGTQDALIARLVETCEQTKAYITGIPRFNHREDEITSVVLTNLNTALA